MNDEYLLENAIGLAKLGMFSDAEAELLEIPSDAGAYDCAQAELLRVQLSRGRYDAAVETGRQLIARGESSRVALFNTSLALSFKRRSKEAHRLLQQLPELGRERSERSLPNGVPRSAACAL